MKLFIKTLCAVAALLAPSALSAQNSISIDSFEAATGSSVDIPVNLDNPGLEIVTFQFDVTFPDGVTLDKDEFGDYIVNSTPRTSTHSLTAGKIEGGNIYRVVGYSDRNRSILGNDGAIVSLPVKLDLETGEYTVTVSNVEITENYTFIPHELSATKSTLHVTAAEEKRYGDNQLYAKDITINQGENATIEVGYNSATEVYEYSASISLPDGVTASDLTFCDAVNVNKYENDWSFENGILAIKGVQGKKGALALAGDNIIATATLSTANLAPGEYTINVADQYLSNDDDDYSPAAYTAKLTVVGSSTPEEKCATPVISINENGHIVVKSTTEGAEIHTTVTSEDFDTFHHANGDALEMTGQYLITAYATAEGMAASEPTTAVLVWTKGASVDTGADKLEAGTERALLISLVGDNIQIVGTEKGEKIALYSIAGVALYSGKATAGTTTIPVALNHGEIYVITVGTHSFKYKM